MKRPLPAILPRIASLLLAAAAALPNAAPAQSITQSFDNVATLAGDDWVMQNNSQLVGTQPAWFQGISKSAPPDRDPFNANSGVVMRPIALLSADGVAQAQGTPPVQAPALLLKQGRSATERKMAGVLVAASRAAALSRRVQEPIYVVIRARVSPALEAFVAEVGGRNLSAFPRFDTLTAEVPPSALAAIAARGDVDQIGPREIAVTHRYVLSPEEEAERRERLRGVITLKAGAKNWQGVRAHGADLAQAAGYVGAGVKVCVLSDGVGGLAARQASGDLPAVDILPGQAGASNAYEGTAMLEIVHDMAPGAALGFATGFNGAAQMATSIINLRQAGCHVIVDDITYYNEGVFQDGPIAQAVNEVTADGALFFSSSANSGNLTHGQSGVFEGDFQASSEPIPQAILDLWVGPPGVLQLHAFANGKNYTTLTRATQSVLLKWSDPLGGSDNDYDLLITDATGTILLGEGTDMQSGTQDPYEIASQQNFPAGSRIYVLKATAAPRALRIDTTDSGRIDPADATAGSTSSHNAAGSAIAVAAVDVARALPGGVFTGGAANPVNTYSSDGPRRMFYRPDGTPITPGNLLFASNGGELLPKVDMAAADCGSTTSPGFATFCGTSAAAPTAAAIAALIKGANPGARNAKVLAALRAAALDIEAPGPDRDSGMGLGMVPAPAQMLLPYTIGGTVTGLRGGAQVELRNNNDLATAQTQGNGAFSFAATHGSTYAITVNNPAGHTCVVAGGSGTALDDVAGVAVACTAHYTLTGAAQPAISGSVACPVQPVDYGGSAPCTATANAGWRFKAFDAASGCTNTSGVGGSTCDINPVQAGHTVIAQFEPYFEGTTVPASGMAPGIGSATFTGGGSTCRFDTSATAFEAASITLPVGKTLPQGMFRFKLVDCDQSAVRISVTWPKPVASYLKYGRVSSTATQDDYYDLTPAHNLVISGNTVSYTVKDGALGDDDWSENGEIADPAGPLQLAAPLGPGGTRAIPTLSQWALVLLTLLSALAGGLSIFGAKSPDQVRA